MEQLAVPWEHLVSGYRLPYDPRPAIADIKSGKGWHDLWENLHHQGDVDTASYAAVPLIADLVLDGTTTDWNAFLLIAVIEEARQQERNPTLPPWAAEPYEAALRKMFEAGLARLTEADEETFILAIFAVLAGYKKQPTLARLALFTESERRQMLVDAGLI